MQKGPILIEENVKNDEWIKKVKPSIQNRISLYAKSEIKFNLLALVPDRLEKAKKLDEDFNKRKKYIEGLINGSIKPSNDNKDMEEYNKMDKKQLENSLKEFENLIKNNLVTIADEEFRVKKYKEENERRQFNYIPFIYELLKIMAEKGELEESYKEAFENENKEKK